MAEVLNETTGTTEFLAERSLVGRGPHCWIRVPHRSVSNEHAVFAFGENGWTLKDLGSRNGSMVNGTALSPGQVLPINEGASIQLGDVGLGVIGVEPPTLCVRAESSGISVQAERGMLVLPDEDSPVASLYELGPGSWELDLDGRVQKLRDADTFYIADERYMVRVPSAEAWQTFQATVRVREQLFLADLTLRLHVSRDQEAVTTTLQSRAGEVALAPRTTHQVLLLLARQRIKDNEAGLEEAECGWLYADELANMLDQDRTSMNVDIHRLRQQVSKAGVLDAARLIERRPTTHQLRLAIKQVVVD